MTIHRRQFLQTTAAAGLVGVLGIDRADAAGKNPGRKMTIDLVCGAIGVSADQKKSIDLAHRHGFESVAPSAGFLGKLSDGELKQLQDDMRAKGLVFGAAGLSVDFRGNEAKFRSGMKNLPAVASALERAGVTRVGTWLRPSHDQLTYVANFKQHARRLGAIAKVLGDHGHRFGLEYVGPKTSWTAGRHSFVHSMAETKELIAAAGQSNMGFVLDSWHWYTAHENEADLLTLKNSDVVAVDLNDAPKGLAIDEQIDSRRELPSATGVIDLKIFMNALQKIGYDGPVRAEPFNAPLRKLSPEEAVSATGAAMKKAFALIE